MFAARAGLSQRITLEPASLEMGRCESTIGHVIGGKATRTLAEGADVVPDVDCSKARSHDKAQCERIHDQIRPSGTIAWATLMKLRMLAPAT